MTEVEDLRAATREAHEAIKDLRAVIREAQDVLVQVKIAAKRAIDEELGTAVNEGLAEFYDANKKAVKDAETAIYDRFATLGDILMGEDRSSKRAGSAIQELAHQWVAEQS